MRVTITGRHLDVTPSLRKHVEKKINKLEKYFSRLTDVHIILYIEKMNHVVEAIMNGDGVKFHGTEKANDMYSSVDLLVHKIEKQIIKHKEKRYNHKGIPPGEWEIEE